MVGRSRQRASPSPAARQPWLAGAGRVPRSMPPSRACRWAGSPSPGRGRARGGRGRSRPEVHAAVQGMPLDVLDIAWPGTALRGSATGHLDYAWKGNRSGRLDLKVRGLSRAGLVLASKPVDVGIAAVVSGSNAA